MELGKSKKSYHKGILPVTVAGIGWLLKAQGHFNGKIVESVEIYGRLVDVNQLSFRLEIALQDHTGRIAGVLYSTEPGVYYGMNQSVVLVQDHYYRVIGVLRFEEVSASLVVTKLENVFKRTDINEFLTRVLIALIDTGRYDLKKKITDVIRKDSYGDGHGITAYEIEKILLYKFNVNDIEENLYELIVQGLIKYGKDWDHYYIN